MDGWGSGRDGRAVTEDVANYARMPWPWHEDITKSVQI
jgi:hypothetical protein